MASALTAPEAAMADLAALSSESSFSGAPTDASSNVASLSSTPPTTVSPDSMSLASDPDVPKQDATAQPPVLHMAIALLDSERDENDQQESGQQTPVGHAIVVADGPPPSEHTSPRRARRSRASLPVYNLSELSGTRVRGERRGQGDAASEKRRRTISGDTLADKNADDGLTGPAGAPSRVSRPTKDGIDALRTDWPSGSPASPRSTRNSNNQRNSPASARTTRRATRLSGTPTETLATRLAALSKRGKKSFEKTVTRMSRELMRLQDTDEFAHIDSRPVRYTLWSNGKYVDVDAEPEPARKTAKVDESTATEKEADDTAAPQRDERAAKKPRPKKWLDKGLYAGQEAPLDIAKGMSTHEKKKLASLPELVPSGKLNKTFPMPMFNGMRLLINGRDFKLPFDVCNPLPPGQPKPAAYRTMTKNRFIGDAAAYWKKTPHFEDFASKCVCKPEDGCAEDCQNRIMLYECDETNCNVGKEHCQNRAFQTLQERTKKGGRYRVGVEVFKTADRGYGVRSNRCFEPNQIIMEYTGEIITLEECDRRMNEEYKDNECYYLMSFDQNMIIDATTGSIARFVNHSCSPNCRMIKWIVSGQPRMALFAGDRPIITGEELTYDYNFDPFSAKNVQKCLCGSPNCRGVLGPKPKETKPPKPSKEEQRKKGSSKNLVSGGKRKLKELLSGDSDGEADTTGSKKRKTQPTKVAIKTKAKSKVVKMPAKSAKGRGKGRVLTAATRVAAKGAATVIRRGVSTVSAKTKSALSRKPATSFVASKGLRQTKISFKTKPGRAARNSSASSLASSTIVAKLPKSRTASPAMQRTPSKKTAGSAAGSPAAGKKTPVSAEAESSRPARARPKKSSIYDFPA